MDLPYFESYSEKSPQWNCLKMGFAGITVWFSYRTPVAFRAGGQKVVRQNEWSVTT